PLAKRVGVIGRTGRNNQRLAATLAQTGQDRVFQRVTLIGQPRGPLVHDSQGRGTTEDRFCVSCDTTNDRGGRYMLDFQLRTRADLYVRLHGFGQMLEIADTELPGDLSLV